MHLLDSICCDLISLELELRHFLDKGNKYIAALLSFQNSVEKIALFLFFFLNSV